MNTGTRRRRILSKPNAVATARIERGVTVKQLATLSGITTAQLYNIESGARGTRESTAQAIARALDKRFSDLFEIVRPETGREIDDDEDLSQWDPHRFDGVRRVHPVQRETTSVSRSRA